MGGQPQAASLGIAAWRGALKAVRHVRFCCPASWFGALQVISNTEHSRSTSIERRTAHPLPPTVLRHEPQNVLLQLRAVHIRDVLRAEQEPLRASRGGRVRGAQGRKRGSPSSGAHLFRQLQLPVPLLHLVLAVARHADRSLGHPKSCKKSWSAGLCSEAEGNAHSAAEVSLIEMESRRAVWKCFFYSMPRQSQSAIVKNRASHRDLQL